MSLEFNAVGDYARINSANALGDGANPTYNGTLVAWYYVQDSTSGREILHIGGASATAYFMASNSTTMQFYVNGAARATWTIAQNTWYMLFMSNSADADSIVARVFRASGAGELAVATGSNTYAGGNYGPVNNICLGNDDAWGDSALGLWRYARWWRAILTQAEGLAEASHTPTSGSPAALTTLLRGSWALPDGTTATDWVSGGVGNITINSGGTSATEPTIGSGGGGGSTRPPNLLLMGVG